MNTPNIFEFTDYRAYLRAFYAAKKKSRSPISYKSIAMKAGFANKGFVYNIFHGTKNLTKTSVMKLSAALGHSRHEAEYFENLVFFNQAQSLDEKEHFFKLMNSVKSKNGCAAKARRLRTDQYEYLSVWYHSVIRSLIGMFGFNGDYEWLARNVYPPILKKQAKASVALLERLGLIEKQSNGTYRLTDEHITTGDEISSLAALHYHRDMTRLAGMAIDNVAKERRNITGLTLGISEAAYKRIVEETNAFRKQIVQIAGEDKASDRVYQMNFHLFPLTRSGACQHK